MEAGFQSGNWCPLPGHYNAHKLCLVKADATLSGMKLVVLPDLRGKLNPYERLYLATCLEVPAEALGGV